MQINVIYDQALDSLPTGFVTAVDYVVNYLDNLFTNPVTINIDLGYGEIAGGALPSGALAASVAGDLASRNLQQCELVPCLPRTLPVLRPCHRLLHCRAPLSCPTPKPWPWA